MQELPYDDAKTRAPLPSERAGGGPAGQRLVPIVQSEWSMRGFLPIAFVVENDETLREGALLDLTARGARLSGQSLPAERMVVALRLRSPRSGPVVAARVVRRDGADVWIEIVSAGPGVLRFWEGLVAAHR